MIHPRFLLTFVLKKLWVFHGSALLRFEMWELGTGARYQVPGTR